jgi:hypothetical protein
VIQEQQKKYGGIGLERNVAIANVITGSHNSMGKLGTFTQVSRD